MTIPFARDDRSLSPSPPRVSALPPAATLVPSRTQRGLVAGVIAGAAVLGLLIGIGRRAGTAWRPINAAAHTVLGAQADGVWNYHGSVTPMGVVVVLVMSAAAGFVVARIASSFRTLHVVMAAAGVALSSYLLHVHVAARTPGGLAALLSVGELRGLYFTLGVALVAGMRFAFSAVDASES